MKDGLARDRGRLVDFLRGVRQELALDGRSEEAESGSRHRCIALIEDDDIDAAVTKALLTRAGLGDLEVTRFRSLGEAELHLRLGRSEVIMVDLGLPDVLGSEVVPAVRQMAPAAPVVVLSGDSDEAMAARALRDGAQDFVVKGTVDAAMLGRTVRLALARADAERALRLSVVQLLVRSDELWSEIERRGEVEEELRREREQLSDLIAQLKGANEVRTEFLATVSHELRTPLTSIIGYTDVLAEMPDVMGSEMALNALEVVERNGRRLLALVEDLLITADIDSNTAGSARESMDVEDLVQSVILAVQPIGAERAQVLSTDIEEGMPAIWGDQSQLERALLNVVSNAIKFTPVGGSIIVSARMAPGGAGIEICTTDTGPGIEPDELDRLFGRFIRGSQAVANQVPGTGLGLGIVKSIIDAHGGEVALRSEVGVGTAVEFTLPTDRRANDEPDGTTSTSSRSHHVGVGQ
ncbi:MAG: response regulator [Actinomycetia bacterium]|nr:response regulator [Actinomycetes bacterium]